MNAGRLSLVVVATVVIFATGVVTGGVLVQKLTPPRAHAPAQPFWNRFEVTRRAVDELDRRGELTPEQRLRIDQIIRDNQDLIAEYFSILEPDLQQVFRKMREGIRAELTSEQRNRFDDFARRRMARFNERRPENSRGIEPDAGFGLPKPPPPPEQREK